MYIEKINGPEDVKKLTVDEMTVMAGKMREALLKRASIHGGHFGPNFGMVEATIALHYVFESPKDKIVYDVSHQTYNWAYINFYKSCTWTCQSKRPKRRKWKCDRSDR